MCDIQQLLEGRVEMQAAQDFVQPEPLMKRLLITGAGGGMGRVMRQRLKPLAEKLRLSDVVDIGEAAAHEEIVRCDLADRDGMMRLVEGCDGIVHLGGTSGEDSFSRIMQANILGLFNLYEAAREHGMPRIVFASSNHVVGFYRQDQYIDVNAPVLPDTLYGVSKCYGEALSKMYYHKFGQETAIVRIGSCFDAPRGYRMMASWLSYGDFTSLVETVFKAPRLGCATIWGISNNDARWWDNSQANFLGWKPKGNANDYRAVIESSTMRPDPNSADAIYQGGAFTTFGIKPDDLA